MTDDVNVKTKGDLNMPDETIRSDLCAKSQNLSKCSFTIDSLLSNDKKPQLQIDERVNFSFPCATEKFDGSCDNVGISNGCLNNNMPEVCNASAVTAADSRCLTEGKLESNVLRRNHHRESDLYHRSYSDGKCKSI